MRCYDDSPAGPFVSVFSGIFASGVSPPQRSDHDARTCSSCSSNRSSISWMNVVDCRALWFLPYIPIFGLCRQIVGSFCMAHGAAWFLTLNFLFTQVDSSFVTVTIQTHPYHSSSFRHSPSFTPPSQYNDILAEQREYPESLLWFVSLSCSPAEPWVWDFAPPYLRGLRASDPPSPSVKPPRRPLSDPLSAALTILPSPVGLLRLVCCPFRSRCKPST